jgi:hypothetical protein
MRAHPLRAGRHAQGAFRSWSASAASSLFFVFVRCRRHRGLLLYQAACLVTNVERMSTVHKNQRKKSKRRMNGTGAAASCNKCSTRTQQRFNSATQTSEWCEHRSNTANRRRVCHLSTAVCCTCEARLREMQMRPASKRRARRVDGATSSARGSAASTAR